MNKVTAVASIVKSAAMSVPVVAAAIAVATLDDIVRAILTIGVFFAIIYQVVVNKQAPDPWLSNMAMVFVGFFFGFTAKVASEIASQKIPGGSATVIQVSLPKIFGKKESTK